MEETLSLKKLPHDLIKEEEEKDVPFTELSVIQKAEKTIIVIPCFNDGSGLRCVLEGIFGYGTRNGVSTDFLEVIVVNDGSTQNIRPFIQYFLENNLITVMAHSVNKGKGEALKTAFSRIEAKNSNAWQVMLLDADLKGITKQKLLEMIERSHAREHVIFSLVGNNVFVTLAQLFWPRWNGTRILSMTFVKKCLVHPLFTNKIGYEIEEIFNAISRETNTKIWFLKIFGITQETKFQKIGIINGAKSHLGMYKKIFEARKRNNKFLVEEDED